MPFLRSNPVGTPASPDGCFRGSLRCRHFVTGFAALPPPGAGRQRAIEPPNLLSCISIADPLPERGSLRSRRPRVFARPHPPRSELWGGKAGKLLPSGL